MASGTHHCEDCGYYFDSERSLEVHLQYHKENLISMWMNNDDRPRDCGSTLSAAPPTTSSVNELVKSEEDSSAGSNVTTASTAVYVKDEAGGFIGAPPVSPMEYDFKMSPGMASPQNTLVSQGPASGSNSSVSFPQQSPSFYNADYNQPLMHQTHQNHYGNYQTYNNGNYDDYYSRSSVSRYHPYIGRSPVPTPSPGTSLSDIEDESGSTSHTPEILDLDSQEVLNSGSQSNMTPIPPMWRPHEQFPSPKGLSNGCPQTIGLGPSSGGMQSSQGGSLGPGGLGSSTIGMMPPMQQTNYSGHSLSTPVAPSVQAPSRPVTSMASYYTQGLSGSSVMSTNNTSNFTPNAPNPPTREAPPPSEYPSNVKRAKSFKCEDCNKWFTSHGHLKRHYNTTLHKNMTKQNNSTPTSTQPATPSDITRPPILSPSAKSIGEASTTSSHEEESSISSSDATESNPSFQPIVSAFQPLQPPMNVSRFELQNSIYPGPTGPGPVGPMNPVIPQPQHFLGNQPLTPHPPPPPPTMYHGHFSTNPTYPPQPPPSIGPSHFFPVNSSFAYPQQGGQHGPGFHSVNDFPGPISTDFYNGYRHEALERPVVQSAAGDTNNAASPEIASPDTASETSMDSSESENNYKCNDCSKTFNRMCYLTQHRSTYHEGEKPFKCGVCGKRFPDELSFTDHQSKHAGEKPYKCEVCPKQFNHKTDLRRHMCLHTGEKPFSCEQCGKGFIRKDHMLKHYQTHKKKSSAQSNTPHPSMPPNPPTLAGHHIFPPPHGIPHPTHTSGGHPHAVAPTVY